MKTKNIKRIIEKTTESYNSYIDYCFFLSKEATKYISWSIVNCAYSDNKKCICICAIVNGCILSVPADEFFVYVKQTIGNKQISKEEYLILAN